MEQQEKKINRSALRSERSASTKEMLGTPYNSHLRVRGSERKLTLKAGRRGNGETGERK